MATVNGEFNGDGKPIITDISGDNAGRIENDLNEWDALQMTLTTVIVQETDDSVQVGRESFDFDEELLVDCTRRYDSNYDQPGIQLEEFPDDLEDRVVEHYNRQNLDHDRKWNGWQAVATAIEKPDRTIRLDDTEEESETEVAGQAEIVERTVALPREQAEWVDSHYIDLSEFLQDKLEELRKS